MTAASHTPPPESTEGKDTFVGKLGESAQQIWLAGLGAFHRAQAEGSRVFDTLVDEGRAYEQKHAREDGNPSVKDKLESNLGQAREQGARAWGKVEQAFDDQIQGVLKRLRVPCREDIETLSAEMAQLRLRISELEAQQARQQAPSE